MKTNEHAPIAFVRGAGDLATGVALSFHGAGFAVLMSELSRPTAIRLTVCFASAVLSGDHVVEGVRAEHATADTWRRVVAADDIAVVIDPSGAILDDATPHVIVDAIMAKRNLGTRLVNRTVVIALGPGFTAGLDADAVIETSRGHELGRIIRTGRAREDTGIPGEIAGRAADRVLRAPSDGRVTHVKRIGDLVATGELIMRVGDSPVLAPFNGCLRGQISESLDVTRGMKIGDVDPRGETAFIHSVSDKAHAVGRAALEAALSVGRERDLIRVRSAEDDLARAGNGLANDGG